jgi:hypothetical protein
MDLPPIGVDLDGVIVRPPFGWNVAISRRVLTPKSTDELKWVRAREPGSLSSLVQRLLRYAMRRPLRGVPEGVHLLAASRRIHIVSARNVVVQAAVEDWLEQHGLKQYIAGGVHLNDTGLPGPYFKLAQLQRLGITEHVDDDGATAEYLARYGGISVYLCSWPRNCDLEYASRVHRVADLLALALVLRQDPASPSGQGRGDRTIIHSGLVGANEHRRHDVRRLAWKAGIGL